MVAEAVVGQLEDSLRALGADYVDVHQSHGGSGADFETPELWEALKVQVRACKIRRVGVSLDPDDGARAARAACFDSADCCILVLSGHQGNTPAGWPGGDRLVIHGTHAAATIGTAARLAACARRTSSCRR